MLNTIFSEFRPLQWQSVRNYTLKHSRGRAKILKGSLILWGSHHIISEKNCVIAIMKSHLNFSTHNFAVLKRKKERKKKWSSQSLGGGSFKWIDLARLVASSSPLSFCSHFDVLYINCGQFNWFYVPPKSMKWRIKPPPKSMKWRIKFSECNTMTKYWNTFLVFFKNQGFWGSAGSRGRGGMG